MKDWLVVAGLVLALASLITAHISIAYGLVRRTPRWRAPLALVVAPLAPYWAWREQMPIRAIVWGAAVILYVITTIFSRL